MTVNIFGLTEISEGDEPSHGDGRTELELKIK
jgi:hypothetical protein